MVGTQQQEKRMGYAADFCRVCREIQPVAIDRLGVAAHFDDIPLEKSQTIGFTAVCQECGLVYRVDPFPFLKLLPAPAEWLAVLIDETFASVSGRPTVMPPLSDPSSVLRLMLEHAALVAFWSIL